MEQKPKTTTKAHEFRTGFFGWYLLGNLGVVAYLILYPLLVHPAFPSNLAEQTVSDQAFATGLYATMIAGTVITAIVLLVKKRVWVSLGMLAAVVANVAIWILLAVSMNASFSNLQRLLTIGIMPLPIGFFIILGLSG